MTRFKTMPGFLWRTDETPDTSRPCAGCLSLVRANTGARWRLEAPAHLKLNFDLCADCDAEAVATVRKRLEGQRDDV